MSFQDKIAIWELAVLIISVITVIVTLILSHRWNRKKVSQETLDGFTVGDLPKLSAEIRSKYKCNIFKEQESYSTFLKKLKKVDRENYREALIRILNIYEVIAINIKNKIIKEKICVTGK